MRIVQYSMQIFQHNLAIMAPNVLIRRRSFNVDLFTAIAACESSLVGKPKEAATHFNPLLVSWCKHDGYEHFRIISINQTESIAFQCFEISLFSPQSILGPNF